MPRTRLKVSALLATVATLLGSLGVGLPTAAAQSDTLTIPASTVIRGNPGDIVELGRLAVDTTRAGPLCTWTATVSNQASVHPNSDILIESNGTTLVVADVEATPNQVTSNSGSVTLAAEVVVSIRLGPDGRFSGRMDVSIDYSMCGPITTTTITAPSTTSIVVTTALPTTALPTTALPTTALPTTVQTETTDTVPAGPDVSADESTTTAAPTTAAPATVVATTTAAPITTQGDPEPTETTDVLPVTGGGRTALLLTVGLVLLAGGSLLSLGAPNRRR